MAQQLEINMMARLEDLMKSERPSGFNLFFRENHQFATSDIHVAAYLQSRGIRCDGTVIHNFSVRGRTKSKVYMVFNHNPCTKELAERIQTLIKDGWGGPEGQNLRLFLAESQDLKKMVNDSIDLDS